MRTYELFIQRNLLKLHTMDASRGGSKQRGGHEDDAGLHADGSLVCNR